MSNTTPLLNRPDWSKRVGRAIAFPPLAPNRDRVTAVLSQVTDPEAVPAFELGCLEAAERVRELYEGDAHHANADWELLTDPTRLEEEPSSDLKLLAEAAKVDAEPILPPPGVPNASNRLTQEGMDAEWQRLSSILWPGMDPGDAVQANVTLVVQNLSAALQDEPSALPDAEAWLGAMHALAVKVAADRRLPLWVGAWRVASAISTLSDRVVEVAARVDDDDADPATAALQRRLKTPLDILEVADAGVVALTRLLADPGDLAGDNHVLITKPLVEATFVGRSMTDDECAALMGPDPDAAYGALEAIVRLACQQGLTRMQPHLAAMAIDRWWTAAE